MQGGMGEPVQGGDDDATATSPLTAQRSAHASRVRNPPWINSPSSTTLYKSGWVTAA
jgi:hypothetical protein